MGDINEYKEALRKSFGDYACVEYFDDPAAFPKIVVSKFHMARRSQKNTLVLSIQGTASAKDVYTDTSFYAIIAVLQGLSHFLPLLDLLPNTFIAEVLRIMRLPGIIAKEREIFAHAFNVIKRFNH